MSEVLPYTRIQVSHNREHPFQYDTNGRLSGITDSVGRGIQLRYNTEGLLERLLLPDGRTVIYGYEASLGK